MTRYPQALLDRDWCFQVLAGGFGADIFVVISVLIVAISAFKPSIS